jgi:hypothetical protein
MDGAKAGAEKSQEVSIRHKYVAFSIASPHTALYALRLPVQGRRRHPGYVYPSILRAE